MPVKQNLLDYSFLIVDDERLSRSYIRDLIDEFVPGSVILEANSAQKAKDILEEGVVDILFLDIKMPGTDGFGLLEMLDSRSFELVFITAYSHYAIQAIRNDAVDYLLKPVKKTEFRQMLRRIMERREKAMGPAGDPAKENGISYLDRKLVLNHQQGTKFIRLRDIVYLKADNTYTTLFLYSGEKVTVSKPISRFEGSLDNHWFFRIHKSYIINIAHFKEYISRNGNIALMDNGDKLYISRYRLGQFLELIKENAGELKL